MGKGDRSWDEGELTISSGTRRDLIGYEPTPQPSTLEVLHPGERRSCELRSGTMVVGREEGVQLRVESVEVSRRHLCITGQGEEFVATDLGSRNGFFLNGVRVHAATLQDGDLLVLGDAVLVFHQGS